MKYFMLDIRNIVTAIVWTTLFSISLGLAQGQQASVSDVESKDPIEYDVDLSDVRNHYLTISVTIPADGDTTELMMAVWTPGSYLVREYARNIDSMEVTAKGKKLKFEKTRKNRWLVQTDGIKSFQVKYRLYCNEMSVRTNWVGKQYAMINGAPSYITVPDRLDHPHHVKLIMPRGWTRSATSLRSTGDTPHTFIAEDFDELVDSPIVAGNVSVYPFTVGGIEHQLVNVGESGYWDGTKAATDLAKIVKAHQDMWGVVPYDRYLFLNMIVESGGGLEHDNSSTLMTSRWTFRESGRYKGWLSLASHEFFHTWNVRRLRPKSLITYDYENEVYTDSLWIAEGITSYYQDLAMVRAGLSSRSEFISKLSRTVEGVQRTGGRKLQSLKDSSYDAWIKYYRPDENSSNTQISYYSKGAVVAFLLDAKIRKLTDGEKSLDDLMRKMFSEFEESGFTTDDFRKTASDLAGEDLTDWFASVIDSTEELNYDDIEAIGVAVPNKKATPKSANDKPAEEKANSEQGDQTADAKKSAEKTRKKKDGDKASESDSGNKNSSKKNSSSKNEAVDKTQKSLEKNKKPPKKNRSRRKKAEEAAAKEEASAKKSDKKSDGKSDKKSAGKSDKKSAGKSDKKSDGEETAQPPKSAEQPSRRSGSGMPLVARAADFGRRMVAGRSSRSGGTTPRPTGQGRPWLGFSSSSADGKVTVSGVKPESPASETGLNNGDEIIAIEGFRVTRSVESRLSQFRVGDDIDILIARRGQIMTMTLTIGTLESVSWRLRLVSRPSDEQKKQLDLWLGPVKK